MLRDFFERIFKERACSTRNGMKVRVQMRVVRIFIQAFCAVFLKAGELGNQFSDMPGTFAQHMG